MLVLGAEAGRVRRIVLEDDHSLPAVITIPGMGFKELHTITRGLQSELKPSYQVTDTLGEDVYLLTFGEAVSSGRISGMIFEDVCDEEDEEEDKRGVSQLIDWWSKENMSKRGTPIQITIGQSHVLQAYIAELQVSIDNPEERTWNFQMNLLRVPNREDMFDSPFAGVLVGPEQPEGEQEGGGLVQGRSDPFIELPPELQREPQSDINSDPFIELPPELQREPQSPITDRPAVVAQSATPRRDPVIELPLILQEEPTLPLVPQTADDVILILETIRDAAGFGEPQRISQGGYATTDTTLTGYLTNR